MTPTAEHCNALAASLGLADFDLLLAGDGAGSFSNTPCGWYCLCYFRPSGRVTEHFGGASGGTNNYAELLPYLHVLWAFHSAWTSKNPGTKPRFRVAVVSDSEVTVRCGSGQYARKANLALWAGIDWFANNGYCFEWRHIPRNSTTLMTRADARAKGLRHLMESQEKHTLPG